MLFLELLHLLRDVKLDLYHSNEALIIGTGHQLEHLELVDARHRQRLSSLVDLANHVLYLRDVLLGLGLLGQAQETLKASSLVFETAHRASPADHL